MPETKPADWNALLRGMSWDNAVDHMEQVLAATAKQCQQLIEENKSLREELDKCQESKRQ